MLFFYLPMIIFGVMFEKNSNGRRTCITHQDDAQ